MTLSPNKATNRTFNRHLLSRNGQIQAPLIAALSEHKMSFGRQAVFALAISTMASCSPTLGDVDTSTNVLILADGYEYHEQFFDTIENLASELRNATEAPGIVVSPCASDGQVAELVAVFRDQQIYNIAIAGQIEMDCESWLEGYVRP